MGRKRQSRNDLPQKMYFKKGAYYFVDAKKKWHRLHKEFGPAMQRYVEIIEGKQSLHNIGQIIDRYLKDEAVKKSRSTLQNNIQESKPLRAVFGEMHAKEIKPSHIYKYLSMRPPISGNREKALLSCLFKFAIKHGIVEINPCKQVSSNPERPRDREVTDREYKAVYDIASPLIQIMMDLVSITGLRPGDLLNIKINESLLEDGVFVRTSKTGKKLLFRWTPGLRSVVERARALRGKISSLYLISNREGQRYTKHGFSAIWQKTMKRALLIGGLQERYTFYDLRARAAGLSARPSELLGHDDARTTNRIYRRTTRYIDPNTLPKNKDR